MYSVVLATLLTAGSAAPETFFHHRAAASAPAAAAPASFTSGCYGCGGCYGGYSCGGYACGGCYGGYTRSYSCGGCWGCGGGCVSYSCGGGCWGCGGCYGGYSCGGGCYSCGGYSCGGYSCGGGCYSCGGGCYSCGGYSCGGASYSCGGYSCGGASYSCGGYSCGGASYSCGGYSCGGASYSCGGYSCGGYSVAPSYSGCGGFSSCYGATSGCFGGMIGTTPSYSVPSYSAPVGCIGGGIISGPSMGIPAGCIGGHQIIGSSAPIMGGYATVALKAPADAVIEVNGTTLTRKGDEQTFNTPTLSATGKHTYEFSATLTRDGKSVTRTRTIQVTPGNESRVDFSELVAELSNHQDRARVVVSIPEEADLYVDGARMTTAGATRKFQTPMLDSGKPYSYEMKATMMLDGQLHESTQKVSIEAGKEVKVEFVETSFVKVNTKVASR